jgi:hypothetical protein
MSLRSKAIQRFWPLTQSLDLVEAPLDAAAAAVHGEIARFHPGERLEASWPEAASLEAAFGTASSFASVPTLFLALPTHSPWTVLWNDCFLGDGYDSLCWCLTTHHKLATIHWSAHDEWTTFQSGASFTHRRREGEALVERSVAAAQEDERWSFRESGAPLPEEDVAGYAARRKRDRLDERRLIALLERLGARPWQEDFYALPGRLFVLRRTAVPQTVVRRTRAEVLGH